MYYLVRFSGKDTSPIPMGLGKILSLNGIIEKNTDTSTEL
jgi:hypothetical protein